MNVVREILAVAREIMAIEFGSESALKKYLKDHPDADKSKHTIRPKKKDDGGLQELMQQAQGDVERRKKREKLRKLRLERKEQQRKTEKSKRFEKEKQFYRDRG